MTNPALVAAASVAVLGLSPPIHAQGTKGTVELWEGTV